MGDGHLIEGSDDPSICAAAFDLVQLLARKGITAGEINITFSNSCGLPDGARVNIVLPSLTDPADAEPKFQGLQGVLALFSQNEEEAAHA